MTKHLKNVNTLIFVQNSEKSCKNKENVQKYDFVLGFQDFSGHCECNCTKTRQNYQRNLNVCLLYSWKCSDSYLNTY